MADLRGIDLEGFGHPFDVPQASRYAPIHPKTLQFCWHF